MGGSVNVALAQKRTCDCNAISVALGQWRTSGLFGEIEPVLVERLPAENDVGGMLGRLMFCDAIAERR
jgi:hypothetical protein